MPARAFLPERDIERARTHVFKAIISGDYDTFSKLLLSGFPVNIVLKSPNITLFMLAASQGSIEIVNLLLTQYRDEVQINHQDGYGRTALHLACKAGKKDVVKLMLSQNPRPNHELRTTGGQTVLMYAAQSGEMFTLAECLNKGMNPFHVDSLKWGVRDFALKFQNVQGGTNLTTLIERAENQWKTQLSEEQIMQRTAPPDRIFHDFIEGSLRQTNHPVQGNQQPQQQEEEKQQEQQQMDGPVDQQVEQPNEQNAQQEIQQQVSSQVQSTQAVTSQQSESLGFVQDEEMKE